MIKLIFKWFLWFFFAHYSILRLSKTNLIKFLPCIWHTDCCFLTSDFTFLQQLLLKLHQEHQETFSERKEYSSSHFTHFSVLTYFLSLFLYKSFLWWTSLLYWLPFCNSFHMFIVLCEKYGVNYSYWGHVILFTFLVNMKSMIGAL